MTRINRYYQRQQRRRRAVAEKLASDACYDQQSNTSSEPTRQVLKFTNVPQNAVTIPQDKISHR